MPCIHRVLCFFFVFQRNFGGLRFLVRLAFIQRYCFSLLFRGIISEGAFCPKIQRAASSFALSKLRSRSFFWHKNPSSKIVLPLGGQRTPLSRMPCIHRVLCFFFVFQRNFGGLRFLVRLAFIQRYCFSLFFRGIKKRRGCPMTCWTPSYNFEF